MKRQCNENERSMLFKNRNQMLKGIYKTSAKSSYGSMFAGLGLSIILMFAGIFPLVDIFDAPKFVFYLWIAFCFTVPNNIIRKVITSIGINKEAKKFLKNENLSINGATIVNIDLTNGVISYIEDDFLNTDGSPIIIDYPALPSELKMDYIGKRILIMYNNTSTFQLMLVNDELARLIPSYSEAYPLMKPIEAHKHIPHPNANSIPFCGHVPSDKEKENLSELYVTKTQGDSVKVLKWCFPILYICVLFLCIVLGVSENSLSTSIPIGLAVCVGFTVFILLMRRIGKNNMKKAADFTYVQEVIFHSNVINQYGRQVSTELKVYEWKNNHFELTSYPGQAAPQKTVYGTVLYKFTNSKGKLLFMAK